MSKINILIVEDNYISAEYFKKLLYENQLSVIDEENTKILLKNNYLIDIKEEKVYKQNQEIFLSEKLLKLLMVLAKYRGNSISNEQISLTVWQDIQNINTIRALIHRLKIKLPGLGVHNINKKGYVIY